MYHYLLRYTKEGSIRKREPPVHLLSYVYVFDVHRKTGILR